jgi:lysophospholipase L1-like esterase
MAGLVCGGCAALRPHPAARMTGESVVFIGDAPAALAHIPLPDQPVHVRAAFEPESGTTEYTEGKDFVLDRAAGTLRRAPGSRLPDFQTNMLFGQEEFDHNRFPGYGNARFFAFVDYAFAQTNEWPVQASQRAFLRATQTKLDAGRPVKIIAFGDSITAGGNASRPGLIFWQRWADELQRKYPQARITAVNGATGGDATRQGLERLQEKVLSQKPDLVLIGFGMNDHNTGGVPLPQFKQNLKEMAALIRAQTGAEVILFSAFPPNPRWKFGSHHMADYAAATAQAATESGCAYADVFNNWQSMAARKKPEDLLANNINHPNDFGHWIYYSVFTRLGL